ncbi:unnamed protein product [Symbiodinium natans]|uniref:Uncharacterized protein n=1 Tax=Symbiodinium natans TaxID=878477 RepID=A0A812IHC5_9DINO|nr:unnamed protein product [Symbiodinium natans]
MFKKLTKFLALLAAVHQAAAQEEGLKADAESALETAPEVEATPVIPPTVPVSPPKAAKVSPPPAPPVQPVVSAARRLEEERAVAKEQLNRDFLDACRKFDKDTVEALLRQGRAKK